MVIQLITSVLGPFQKSELAGLTSYFDDEIGFFKEFFLKENHLLCGYYSGFE